MLLTVKKLVIYFFLLFFYSEYFLIAANQSDSDSGKSINYLKKSQEEDAEIIILLRNANSSSDSDTIIFYSKKALQLSKTLNLNPANSLVSMGYGYVQSGQHAKALRCFTNAASHYKLDDNIIGLGSAYVHIAQAYNIQRNHANTIFYLKKALFIFEQEKDSSRLAAVLHNLGYEYYTIGESDSALSLFESTRLIYEKLNLSREATYCIGNSGLVYLQQEKYDAAAKYLLDAIKELASYSPDYSVIEFMIAYAHVLQKQGEITNALAYASKSYSLAEKNNISKYISDAAFRLSELYNLSNQYDSAYFYHKEFTAISDSIKNFETIQKMADLRTEFEVAQKQSEVDILTKNKTVQLIIIASMGLILLLACWIIYMYYKNMNRSRKFAHVLDERRKALEKQGLELKELNYIKDKFFSIISHDLRTPISSLGGISFMIKESIEHDNKAMLSEITEYIDESVISLTGLLENLLNWSLSQQGKLIFKVEQLDIKNLLNEVIGLFPTTLVLKNISLKLDLQEGLFISGEKNSLMTVFRNILSNSLKFTPKGGEISVSTHLNNTGYVEICFSDTGIGIPEDKVANLFALKDNKSTRGTENEKGLGLGLNLVHEFVMQNKGEIKVESKVGVGTKFILEFKQTTSKSNNSTPLDVASSAS